MQEKISPNLHFLHRTDALADKLGVTVKELDSYLKCSWRTIISGRQEGGTITRKTWHKLEQAERAAGIAVRTESHPLLTDFPVEEQPSDAALKAAWHENKIRNPTDHYSDLKVRIVRLIDKAYEEGDKAGREKEFDWMVEKLHLVCSESVYRAALQHLVFTKTLKTLTGMEEPEELSSDDS